VTLRKKSRLWRKLTDRQEVVSLSAKVDCPSLVVLVLRLSSDREEVVRPLLSR
jgi:hypothetical protein